MLISIHTDFCWETCKPIEDYTYVVKFVSFGNGSAGIIATMELRKTAELGREEYSKAANTVLQNTYTDVIIDSVASVSEAKELSRDIDALLKMGSFYVKGWSISAHENSDCGEAL